MVITGLSISGLIAKWLRALENLHTCPRSHLCCRNNESCGAADDLVASLDRCFQRLRPSQIAHRASWSFRMKTRPTSSVINSGFGMVAGSRRAHCQPIDAVLLWLSIDQAVVYLIRQLVIISSADRELSCLSTVSCLRKCHIFVIRNSDGLFFCYWRISTIGNSSQESKTVVIPAQRREFMRHYRDCWRLLLFFAPLRRFRLSLPRRDEGGKDQKLNRMPSGSFASWSSVIAAHDLEGHLTWASWLYGKLPQYSKSLLALASQEKPIANNTFRVSMVVDASTLRVLSPQNWKFRFVSKESVDPTAVPPPGYVLQAELAEKNDICRGALIVMHEEFLKVADIYIIHNMKHILHLQMGRTHLRPNATDVDSQFVHIFALAGLENIYAIKDEHDRCTIDPLWIWPATQGQAVDTARALFYQARLACFPELSAQAIRVYLDHHYMRWVRNRKVHYVQNLVARPSAEDLRSVHMIEVAEATHQLEEMGSVEIGIHGHPAHTVPPIFEACQARLARGKHVPLGSTRQPLRKLDRRPQLLRWQTIPLVQQRGEARHPFLARRRAWVVEVWIALPDEEVLHEENRVIEDANPLIEELHIAAIHDTDESLVEGEVEDHVHVVFHAERETLHEQADEGFVASVVLPAWLCNAVIFPHPDRTTPSCQSSCHSRQSSRHCYPNAIF
ncbi:hypothetical protein SELMODRAFT_407417 [Selaginella moellendorffii]|uniref:Uncharacterized protein n=1 Tax=Selaginella moellendorffii TaxID=88036 RepID=D8R5J1_SELML|nr:hypothetical protein SELMODRAFT_407417 [Selaginella moellendorffii]